MNQRIFLLTAVVTCIGLITATNADPPAAPVYEFKLQKAEDSIAVKTDDKRTVLVVTSASGIGNAMIKLTAGQWPKHIALRFEYTKDRGFTMLEGFSLTTARLQIQDAARPGQRKMPFHLLDNEGKPDAGESPAGELNVMVERRQGALEITLPANLFIGSKEMKVSWIDFYR